MYSIISFWMKLPRWDDNSIMFWSNWWLKLLLVIFCEYTSSLNFEYFVSKWTVSWDCCGVLKVLLRANFLLYFSSSQNVWFSVRCSYCWPTLYLWRSSHSLVSKLVGQEWTHKVSSKWILLYDRVIVLWPQCLMKEKCVDKK